MTVLFCFVTLVYAQRGKEAVKNDKVSYNVNTNYDADYSKSKNANTLFKLSNTNVGVWYDQNKWTASESGSGIAFEHKDSYFLQTNLYFYSTIKSDEENVNDEIEIWEGIFKNIEIIANEKRKVNNTFVYFLEIDGDFGSTPERTIGYYKSMKNGTITFRCVIASDKYHYYIKDILELLNGFVQL